MMWFLTWYNLLFLWHLPNYSGMYRTHFCIEIRILVLSRILDNTYYFGFCNFQNPISLFLFIFFANRL